MANARGRAGGGRKALEHADWLAWGRTSAVVVFRACLGRPVVLALTVPAAGRSATGRRRTSVATPRPRPLQLAVLAPTMSSLPLLALYLGQLSSPRSGSRD